jgi:hypothetical protein
MGICLLFPVLCATFPLPGLFSSGECGRFFRNVGTHLLHYIVSYLLRPSTLRSSPYSLFPLGISHFFLILTQVFPVRSDGIVWTSAPGWGEWPNSPPPPPPHPSPPLCPLGKSTRYPLNRKLDRPQNRNECYEKMKIAAVGKRTSIVHYSVSVIPQSNGRRDSSVGITTGCGLDGPGIESWWVRDFPHPSRTSLRPTLAGSFGGKVTGAWRWPPTPT